MIISNIKMTARNFDFKHMILCRIDFAAYKPRSTCLKAIFGQIWPARMRRLKIFFKGIVSRRVF